MKYHCFPPHQRQPVWLLQHWLQAPLLLCCLLLGINACPLLFAQQPGPATDPAPVPPQVGVASPMSPGEQAEAEETEVLRAVVRVSWKMIDRLADDQIDAEVPFQSSIMGGQMAGQVRSKADITIDFREHHDHAHFDIVAEGTARGHFNASRDNVRLSGPMTIPFRATKEVVFDGRQFMAGEPLVEANVHVRFNCVGLRRNGPLARLVQPIVANAAERERPRMERAAEPLAEQYLARFAEEEMDAVVAQLNQVSAVEASVLRVYPQLDEWKVRLSSTEKHLIARYAPPGSEPLVLPEDSRRPDDAGIEVWIRTTREEARLLERISSWDQSQQLLKSYLKDQAADVQEMASDAKVMAIDDWLLVAVGKEVAE